MARPMTVAQMRAQLKKFNQPFVEKSDFSKPTSGRDDETGLYFGPVYGTMNHHTGSDSPDRNNSSLIDNGRTGLPGPLANAGCRDDGVLELFTMGRANHAGKGDTDVLRAVLNEDYGKYPPEPNRDSVDGNDHFYGLEIYYSGSKPPTAKAYRAAVNWNAAICDFHDWTAKSAIGHGEWTYRKWDPGHLDMAKLREDVDDRIAEVNRKIIKPSEADDNLFKIITWNAGHQTEANIMRNWRKMLATYTPDVFCGQEFYRVNDPVGVPSYNFRYQAHMKCPEYPKYISEHPANIVVARNTGVVKSKHGHEMETPWRGPNLNLWHSPRVHREIVYRTGGQDISVLDFHGLAVRTGREESLLFARDWLGEKKKLGPAVIVGDFNAQEAEVVRKIAKPNGASVAGDGIDLAVSVGLSKVSGKVLSKYGSDHHAKEWKYRF